MYPHLVWVSGSASSEVYGKGDQHNAGDFIKKMGKIFVSDYDGTITDKDFYSLLAEHYAPANTPDYFAQYREGRITHFEAMAAYFAFAPTDEQQIEELLE